MISQSTKAHARKAFACMLNGIEWQIIFAKAKVSYHWEHSDKTNPIDTAYHFEQLNMWKNDLRKSRKTAATLRKALKELK